MENTLFMEEIDEVKSIEATNKQRSNLVSICRKYNYNFVSASKQELINEFNLFDSIEMFSGIPDYAAIIILEKNEKKICIIHYTKYVIHKRENSHSLKYRRQILRYAHYFSLLNNKIPSFRLIEMNYLSNFLAFGFICLMTIITILGGLQTILMFGPFLIIFGGIIILFSIRNSKLKEKYKLENKKFTRKYLFDLGNAEEIKKLFTYKVCEDFLNLKIKNFGLIISRGHWLDLSAWSKIEFSYSLFGRISERKFNSIVNEAVNITKILDQDQ